MGEYKILKRSDVLHDDDEMPYGKHKGTKMANVPSDYLLWLYDNDKCSGKVLSYIEVNLDALRQGK